MIPNEVERKAILRILEETDMLSLFGDSSYFTSKLAKKLILYLSVAKSEKKLPSIINLNWKYYDEFIEFLGVKKILDG